jgi:hypothetical protein
VLRDDLFHPLTIGALDIDRADAAIGTVAVPRLPFDGPARGVGALERRTCSADVVGTILDAPAGDRREETPDPGDADLLVVDRLTEAPDPVQIGFSVETVLRVFPDGEDETGPLVETEGGDGDAEDIGGFSDGVEGLFFHDFSGHLRADWENEISTLD